MGWLGDLLDKRKMMMGLFLALSFSVLLMGYTAEALIFTPCMIVYSLSYGGLASLQEPIRADYFGTKAFRDDPRHEPVYYDRRHFYGADHRRLSL